MQTARTAPMPAGLAPVDDGALRGKTVLVVHPAWHSCGTYGVVRAQVAAWRTCGANVVTLACSDQPLFVSARSRLRADYIANTPELDGTHRLFAGTPVRNLATPAFLKTVLWPYLHLDQARIRAGMAEHSVVVGPPLPARIDLVHCNHFFCVPVAKRMAIGAPVVVETHDIQADQFSLMNRHARFHLKPRTSHDAMFRQELAWLRQADAIVHLNAQDHATFSVSLPDARHELIYPAIDPMPAAQGRRTIIVASGNMANVGDVIWFLEEVLPLFPEIDLAIYGSVDRAVAARRPDLFTRHRDVFKGRVDDLPSVYAQAGIVLLPSRAGHGLSIKAVEALSSGARIVATRHAFRGMSLDMRDFPNVLTADEPVAFSAGMRVAAMNVGADTLGTVERRRAAYFANFGAKAYAARLAALALSLIKSGETRHHCPPSRTAEG